MMSWFDSDFARKGITKADIQRLRQHFSGVMVSTCPPLTDIMRLPWSEMFAVVLAFVNAQRRSLLATCTSRSVIVTAVRRERPHSARSATV